MMKKIQLKLDSRNRICLTKLSKDLPEHFIAYKEKDKIVLEPLATIPASEAWLFKPENRVILDEVKKGLMEKGTIKLGSFKKYLK